jgi:hypothetical protein
MAIEAETCSRSFLHSPAMRISGVFGKQEPHSLREPLVGWYYALTETSGILDKGEGQRGQ